MISEIKDNGQRVFIVGTKKERESYEMPLIWWNNLTDEERKEYRNNNKPLDLDEITNKYNQVKKIKMSKDDLIKVLEKCEWATINLAINEKHGCLLIPQEKWEDVSDELASRLEPGEEYKDCWCY